jgi:hypothetical protein
MDLRPLQQLDGRSMVDLQRLWTDEGSFVIFFSSWQGEIR